MIIKEQQIIKLFTIFPIYGKSISENGTTWKLLGIPFFKVKNLKGKNIKKYYLLGLPITKINEITIGQKNG